MSKCTDLYFPAPRRILCTIRDISELPQLNPGDQIKVDMELTREEMVEWENRKTAIYEKCKDMGAAVYGTKLIVPETKPKNNQLKSAKKTNAEYFAAFCSTEKVPTAIKKAGSNLL